MSVYVEVQPQILQKRLEEMNKAQQEAEAEISSNKTDVTVPPLETNSADIS